MRIKGWIAGALVAGGVVLALRGCLSKPDPDERLARRLSAMCEIARDHIATPKTGTLALGRYLGKHLGDITGDFGDTIAIIEKISDDDRHDARAELARDRIRKPLNACERDWQRFADAVARDPEATKLVVVAAERLDRTFEILFGSTTFDLRRLPQQLERAISE